MRRLLTRFALGLACLGLVVVPTPAQAHSGLVDAAPGPGDRVTPGAAVVALTFTGLDAGGRRQIVVLGPDGAPQPVGKAVVADVLTLCAAVQPLATGIHAVAYEATSLDQETLTGNYQFEVAADGRTVDIPEPCLAVALPAVEEPAGSGARGSTVAAVAGVAAVWGVLLAVWLVQHARRRWRG